MEVKETAACGISQREFAIEFDDNELVDFYRVLLYAHEGTGFYDEDYLEELRSQLSYVLEDTAEDMIKWEDTAGSYTLNFNEDMARRLNQILAAVEHPGEGFDKALNRKLMDQMLEMAPNTLQDLPKINR
jgi:hypothetical protein